MILDGHIHIDEGPVKSKDLLERMKAAGIDGGVLLSMSPNSFGQHSRRYTAKERLQNLMEWTDGNPQFYPFFWIDPVEADAGEQVQMALEMGVKGFKIICSGYYPGDPRVLEVCQAIADAGKPVLFHSGILWDGRFSSVYNRPAEFEALLETKGIRFALAHISWPWCDESIAVFGKYLNAQKLRPELTSEMYIDSTPGTPVIYREEALTKLFKSGYVVGNHVIFGTDCVTSAYDSMWASEWVKRDRDIFSRLALDEEVVQKVFSKNLLRFLAERN